MDVKSHYITHSYITITYIILTTMPWRYKYHFQNQPINAYALA